MKSENQNNSLFRPLKKASTVAMIAVALFASAAHADLGEKITGKEAQAHFMRLLKIAESPNSPNKPLVQAETKSGTLLLVQERGLACTAYAKGQVPNRTISQAECHSNDEASLAK
ncbi:hypothetical protein D3C87_1321770 [compost metagenome]